MAGCADNGTDAPAGGTEGGDATDTNDSDSNTESNSGGTETESEGGTTDDGSDAEPETTEDSLDLREANVVNVTFDTTDGIYDFHVSLHHDDDGEAGYANWWQVERLDGTNLGRRELTHAHSAQPFTRNETIEVPDDVDCVVVRGHDQTHGWGGRAMVVDVNSGATRSVDQGSEKQAFDPDACPG